MYENPTSFQNLSTVSFVGFEHPQFLTMSVSAFSSVGYWEIRKSCCTPWNVQEFYVLGILIIFWKVLYFMDMSLYFTLWQPKGGCNSKLLYTVTWYWRALRYWPKHAGEKKTDSEKDLSEGLQLYDFSKAAGQQISKSQLQWWQLDISAWLQVSSRESVISGRTPSSACTRT